MRNTTNLKGQQMKVKATSYTGKQLTYIGTQARYGVIAVDPKVIPMGTRVYIPHFDKIFIAEDCGSAIKGAKIDIWLPTYKEAMNWGIREIDIIVLDK